MRFNVLGSGSTGNATLIIDGDTRVLVDCGLSAKELAKRLADVGETLAQINGIVITHEHSDHIRGLTTVAKNLRCPVYISPQAFQTARLNSEHFNLAEQLQAGQAFGMGSMKFTPICSPHDSVDPLIFTIEAQGAKMAIVTDLGHIPKSVAQALEGCDALVLEANHDLDRLKASAYPWTLKQRVLGRLGHLSNDEMARFLREDYDGQAQYIVLAHLSRENNHPEIARAAAHDALSARLPLFAFLADQQLSVASHNQPLGWIEL